ncbi:MAG TPA: hypothetical protein VFN16_06655 [Saccharospirillum sp.]|nr:hypothetical protein [Saccharospirillum sp.]
MIVPVKKRREKSRSLDQWCQFELESGPSLIAGAGYFDYQTHNREKFDRARMLADWQRHREKIIAAWIIEYPGTRPYAWWKFDAPGPREENETEYTYLARHALLTESEKDPE